MQATSAHAWHVTAGLLLCAINGLACATAPQRTAREIAHGTVQGSLQELNAPHNQRLLSELLRSPELQAAVRELAANVTVGALEGLTSDEQVARIRRATDRLTLQLSSSLAEGLRLHLSQQLAAVAAQSTTAALEAALSERPRMQVELLSAAIARSAGQGFAASLREDMGPAIRNVLVDQVGPGLSEMARAELGRADERTRPGSASTRRDEGLSILGLTIDAVALLPTAACILLLVSACLLIWALRMRSRLQRHSAEIERKEASLLLLTRAIKATENKPWASELRQTLREAVRDDEAARYLRETLRKHEQTPISGTDPGTQH